MQCASCGTALPPETAVCYYCGASLSHNASSSNDPAGYDTPTVAGGPFIETSSTAQPRYAAPQGPPEQWSPNKYLYPNSGIPGDVPNLLTNRSLSSRIERMYEVERFSTSRHGGAGGTAGERSDGRTPCPATGWMGEACGGTPQGSRPGPYADEHTRQGGGAIAGPTGHVPARVLSRT